MNQRDKEKLKISMQSEKQKIDKSKKINDTFNNIFQNFSSVDISEMESFKMIDLLTEIMFYMQYLDVFKNSIRGTEEDISYYNILFINRHLKTILNEFEIITNNLDNIIFEDNDLCG